MVFLLVQLQEVLSCRGRNLAERGHGIRHHHPHPKGTRISPKKREFMGEIKKSPTTTVVERVLKGGWDSEI